MNFRHALTYVFQDQDWAKKILIPGAIAMIPVFGFIYLLGWLCEIFQRSQNRITPELPDGWSLSYLKNGFKMAVSLVVYSIPFLIIYWGKCLFDWLWKIIFSGGFETFVLSMTNFFYNILMIAYIGIILFAFPVILYTFVQHYSIRDTFDFQKIYLTLKSRKNVYFQLLAVLAAALIVGSMGISILYVGVIFTLPYALAAYGDILGTTA